MPRVARHAPGGIIYHVLNRANGRLRLFKTDEDFHAFFRVLIEAHRRVPIRMLDWCVMGNHWHLVLWPQADGELTAFVRWLTLTHAQRWKAAHDAVGHGHLYQGRFRSFPVQTDEHLLTVLRYVERNPVRAKLVRRAQDWRWGSCHVRHNPATCQPGEATQPDKRSKRSERSKLSDPNDLRDLSALLCDWPVQRPTQWLSLVNRPQTEREEQAVQASISRGRPFGSEPWVRRTAATLELTQSLHPQGRPVGWRKPKENSRVRGNRK